MRELRLLAALAFAAVLGFGAAFVFAPGPAHTTTPHVPVTKMTLDLEAVSSAVGKLSSNIPVKQIVGTHSSDVLPIATYHWTGPEKEAAIRRVERLTRLEAEYLCFTLNLISRDEVFDKVNVKGRLLHYVDAMSGPGDLRDLENAFRQMAMR